MIKKNYWGATATQNPPISGIWPNFIKLAYFAPKWPAIKMDVGNTVPLIIYIAPGTPDVRPIVIAEDKQTISGK